MSEEAEKKTSKKRTPSAFPKKTLMQALAIAEAIQRENAGQPYARLDLAQALKSSPTSSSFKMLITASGQFGLTKGSYVAESISLTDLGKSIVSTGDKEKRGRGLREAFLSIPVFRQFFEKYDNEKLPKAELIQKTLEKEFGMSSDDVKACYRMIVANAKSLNLLEDHKGSNFVRLSRLSTATPIPSAEEESRGGAVSETSAPGTPPVSEVVSVIPQTPKVFVSHGKNKKILELVQKILRYGRFEPVVAEEEETIAVPVSDKVLDSMRQCKYGLMNISLDNKEKREDSSYGVNQNVLIEVGAAFVLYNKRVILLCDKRVTIPSNLQGLYRCEYEGDELDGTTTMKLLETLTKFKEPPT